MFNYNDPYNTNPFKHRRMSLVQERWVTAPIYPFAKSYYEPLDPTGRFFYGKSGAFKEFWDDATQNKMHQLLVDGTYLDVIKPIFISGVSKVDSIVIAPGAVTGITAPQSQVTPWSMGPNLAAAMQALQKQEADMSDSTQTESPGDTTTPGVSATAVVQAQNQARLRLGVFGIMVADLVRQVGELVMDCIIQHTTIGELDATTPGALNMKFKTIL